ncbi:MAG: alpha/beta hydrolase [Candidatus Obscuribacterales bacterium]|nr:alpha/beta hydrolase [Steroidobacteraceae bacterium]
MRRLIAITATVLCLFVASVQAGGLKHEFLTTSDGVKIHYMTLGKKGSWVVLVHGYTDNAERMWLKTGIAHALAKNHRVLAFDNRNHGRSDKPQPNGFGRAEDVIELLDHLQIAKAHIHGYSMGGSITAHLMANHPDRFITAAFGGSGIPESDEKLRAIATALDPPMPEPQGEEVAAFGRLRSSSEARAREAGDKPGSTPMPRSALVIDLKKIDFPVLAINGEHDRPFSKTQRLWRELNDFQNVIIPKKNHVSAIMVGGPMPPEYIAALTKFIDANDTQ